MSSVSEVNESNWEKEILKHETVVIVDFWDSQCHWCKVLEPVYAEIASEYSGKVKFAKIQVSENPEIAKKYGVWGTPTLVIFCGGRQVGSITGFRPKEGLISLVEEIAFKYRECAISSTEVKVQEPTAEENQSWIHKIKKVFR